MNVDRKKAPGIYPLQQPAFPPYEVVTLANGLQVVFLHFPAAEVLKIEVAFHSGRHEEKQRLTAHMAPLLMLEGAAERSGAEIAEHLDFYGASLSGWSWLDAVGFTLTGLGKYAEYTVPAMADVLRRPTFLPAELDNLIQTHIRELKVELEKVEVVSYRVLTEKLYGKNHPLGYNSTPEDYLALTVESIRAFWKESLVLSRATMIVTGDCSPALRELLVQYFGDGRLVQTADRTSRAPEPEWKPGKRTVLQVAEPAAVQAGVKMGSILFNRFHPDFYELQVLNTILGGYFGSRLMANIREEKGFTYNIQSGIDTYFDSGYWYISTEVNKEKVAAVVRAIRAEMKRLQTKMVDAEELEMVRNYMLGGLLNGFDGPLNLSQVLRVMIFEKAGEEGYRLQMEVLQTITPERLLELAQQYLVPDNFLTVVVS